MQFLYECVWRLGLDGQDTLHGNRPLALRLWFAHLSPTRKSPRGVEEGMSSNLSSLRLRVYCEDLLFGLLVNKF
jgi:hypothetical protein